MEIYHCAEEHMDEELKLLDLRINLHLTYKKAAEDNPAMDHLKGLVLFEEEIRRLLIEEEATSLEYIQELREEIEHFEQLIAHKIEQSRANQLHLPLAYLVEEFQLSPFEKELLILAVAFEKHRKYEKIFAYLQDDVTYKRPTLDLAMKLCQLTELERIEARESILKKSRFMTFLLRMDEEQSALSFMSRTFRLEERVVSFLLNSDQIESSIAAFTNRFNPLLDQLEVIQAVQADNVQDHINQFMSSHLLCSKSNSPLFFFHLYGQNGVGKKLQVKQYARNIGQSLILIDLRKMLLEDGDFHQGLLSSIRESILQKAILCFYNAHVLFSPATIDLTEEKRKLLFVQELEQANIKTPVFILADKQLKPVEMTRKYGFIAIHLKTPEIAERKLIWEELSKAYPFEQKIDWGGIASKFRFTFGQIENALIQARHLGQWRNTQGSFFLTLEDLHQACYMQVEHGLEGKAQRVDPRYSWDDLILPDEQKMELRNACNQIKYRHVVYGAWGFNQKLAYGKGLSLLFTGPPGTGKTMSAQIIAHELNLQLYKIDLSQVISKYIGETEKNLQEIFAQAQSSHAILFFDEADALFGKRSEVKDAHDKYANIETSYLLQKIEEYEGISVLASNYLQNIDEAFLRRIQFVIKYPFPDQAYRQQIWESLFPSSAPLSTDLDTVYLAEKLELSGGQIKNIVVASAFLAAEQEEPIGMRHIIKAAKHEVQKSGKIFLLNELETY
ncbi:AAA family ATPase [Bacillus horti]|uniref:Cdc6-like AAA superfamily ATPase n=1 Tax=Caldalkalibacillus horti TaxID=77523 RepID=A0ABT9VZX8_9BACI|nr:ATP-binding protein [Bacillus horti]MDQ0166554.1 Cdc6-like AAA superfamily ATPase [Bacillus horti]